MKKILLILISLILLSCGSTQDYSRKKSSHKEIFIKNKSMIAKNSYEL